MFVFNFRKITNTTAVFQNLVSCLPGQHFGHHSHILSRHRSSSCPKCRLGFKRRSIYSDTGLFKIIQTVISPLFIYRTRVRNWPKKKSSILGKRRSSIKRIKKMTTVLQRRKRKRKHQYQLHQNLLHRAQHIKVLQPAVLLFQKKFPASASCKLIKTNLILIQNLNRDNWGKQFWGYHLFSYLDWINIINSFGSVYCLS